MNLEKPYQIAEIVASVALVISLIYVAVQVQQNTQAMQLTAGNYAADQARKIFVVAASPHNRELVFKAILASCMTTSAPWKMSITNRSMVLLIRAYGMGCTVVSASF